MNDLHFMRRREFILFRKVFDLFKKQAMVSQLYSQNEIRVQEHE